MADLLPRRLAAPRELIKVQVCSELHQYPHASVPNLSAQAVEQHVDDLRLSIALFEPGVSKKAPIAGFTRNLVRSSSCTSSVGSSD